MRQKIYKNKQIISVFHSLCVQSKTQLGRRNFDTVAAKYQEHID